MTEKKETAAQAPKKRTPKKRAPAKKAATKRASKKTASPKKTGSWKKRLLGIAIKLTVAVIAVVLVYGIYLDGKVSRKMTAHRYQIPAQIYAMPMELYPGKVLSKKQLMAELDALNYRRVGNPGSPGEYSVSSKKVDLYRRSFDFAQGPQPAQRVMITFAGSRISRLHTLPGNKPLAHLPIEPQVLQRLTSTSSQDRIFVPREDIPERLIDTLVLVEDRNFYHHSGVAPLAIARALVVNIQAGRTVQGGSTLTQQLAKNVFLTQERSLWRKVKEAYLALILDFRFSKDEIIEAYINEVFLGQNHALGIHGFALASQFYFARPLDELTTEQIALLVSMVKGASYYNPFRHPERAQKRRDVVLRLMVNNNHISADEYRNAVSRPLGVMKSARNTNIPGFISVVRNELNRRFGDVLTDSSGLRIFTTLDPYSQRAAEKAVKQRLAQLEKSSKVNKLEAAMIIADRQSGEIRALVGGRNSSYAGFNRALNAYRPIGSLIKPLIFLTALEQGGRYTLATSLEDKPITLKSDENKRWQPKNYDKQFRQQAPLIDSLAHSYNVPTVNLGMELGLNEIADSLQQAGWKQQVPLLPSMLLGALEASPWQVSQLYQTLANDGLMQQQHAIIAVRNDDGALLDGDGLDGRRAFSVDASYLLHYAMNRATTKGTARSLQQQFSHLQLAGKTGTTNDLRDSWYSGFDQQDVVTIWVGRDDNKPAGLTGSKGALAVYRDYLGRHGASSLSLAPPPGITQGHFNIQTGQAVADDCHNITTLPVLANSWRPAKGCDGLGRDSVLDKFLDLFSKN